MKLGMYYTPAYATTDSPLYARLAVAASKLQRLGLVETLVPPLLDTDCLRGLHSDAYLDAFLQGRGTLASSQGIAWTPAIRDAVLAMLAGQLAGASHALQHGLAMNLARGFHHAVRERGGGYCAINGLALVAAQHPRLRVFVLDCDEHGGNGTEEFAAELPNLYAMSIFGSRYGCNGGVRSQAAQVHVRAQGFARYAEALDQAFAWMDVVKPDLALYQAGTDCHWRDPKSRVGLSTRELFWRDQRVFAGLRQRGIPVLFVVAGGYQAAENIARLNANTVRAARFSHLFPVRSDWALPH
ncbi:MAG TPA: hypothetical protein VGV14_04170 [Rhodanobacter sp.]|nr:hypothetical protein [Rhodanobacter sp.]